MHFQPLARENLAATQQIAAELFPWEREHQTALAAALEPDRHRSFFATRRLSTLHCWTIHRRGGPVSGLAALYGYAAQPHEVWLAWFGLRPEARGCGNGRKALDWVVSEARREGKTSVRLWTTDELEYAAAVQLYLSRGFTAEPHPALPGEAWRTLVLTLSLTGEPVPPWSAVPDRGELCGREAPAIAAAA